MRRRLHDDCCVGDDGGDTSYSAPSVAASASAAAAAAAAAVERIYQAIFQTPCHELLPSQCVAAGDCVSISPRLSGLHIPRSACSTITYLSIAQCLFSIRLFIRALRRQARNFAKST